jgi:glyoxylase-like metal-dependent hydrolase (beta-lactamase superfamily II)
MSSHSRIITGAVLCLLWAAPLGGQEGTLALQSYQKARQALDQALAAHGGLQALRDVQRISVRHEGTFYNRNQSRRVAAPYDPTPSNGFLAVDYRGGRLIWEQETGFPGGFRNQARLVITPAGGWQANLRERRLFTVQNTAPPHRNLLRRLPQTHLLAAVDRAASLRWLGESTWRGRKHAVITYAAEDGLQTLFLDRKTGTLSKLEQLFTDPLTGDALLEILYEDYLPVGSIRMPNRRILRRAGETVEEVRFLDIAVDGPFPDSLELKPTDYIDGSATPPPDTTVSRLGGGVYLVPLSGGNNSLAIEFRDYLVVIEPYGNDGDSRRALARIRAALPEKPVRYIVPTHHHDDHTGGLRTYVAEGITVLTTPGNRTYVERMARSRRTLDPDLQSERGAPLKLEMTRGPKTVLSDGEQVVELIDIGPGPHAEEMLVAWLPREKLVFQGDLLNRPADGRPRAGNLTTRHFADWLKASGLPVERIAGVHGPVATMQDLETALTLMAGS